MNMDVDRTELTDVEYVKLAIEEGDMLGPRPNSEPPTAERRALIVAPVYREVMEGFPNTPVLEQTTRDVRSIRQALLKRRYQPENIRILVEGFKFGGCSDATRENVINSLEWLVAGARTTDHRFFHFSGHGERFLSKQGRGKEARRVPGAFEAAPDDPEHSAGPVGRVTSQVIDENEHVYYKEAILLQPRLDAQNNKLEYLVKDKELNKIFSKLPSGCTLTCVVDCCASGRIINNAVKDGDSWGFRGKSNQQVEESLPSPNLKKTWAKNNEPSLLKEGIVVLQKVFDPEASKPTRMIFMEEELPEEELAMDQINANAYTWAACHQRQGAAANPSDGYKSGLLTSIFTEELNQAPNELTVQELFKKVSERVRTAISDYAIQYAQLRVSMPDRSKENLDKLMNLPVVSEDPEKAVV